MIVEKDGGIQTNSLYPNSDWYDEGNAVIDETTETGRVLAAKILTHYPNIEFVYSESGEIVDVTILAPDIEDLRANKKRDIGAACSAAIYAGVDVGGSHYSLEEHDQIEIMAQLAAVRGGAQTVPYHADGELCRLFTAEEFAAVATAATAHIFYHRTYCNHLNVWIARADAQELSNITYGAELPQDLRASMDALIAEAL